MWRVSAKIVWRGLLLIALTGCSHFHAVSPCCGPLAFSPSHVELPSVKRGIFKETVLNVSFPAVDSAPMQRTAPHYVALDAHRALCLAADNSKIANHLINWERQLLVESAARRCKGQNDSVTQMQLALLTYTALADRNQSAADALEYYYKLAGVEAQWDLLQESLAHVDNALKKTEELKKQGLPLPADEEQLRRQRLALQAQGVQLQQKIREYNDELHLLLGFAPCEEDRRFRPVDAFALTVEPVDLHLAINTAVTERPELNLLRDMMAQLDSQNMEAARQMMKSYNVLLGMTGQQTRCAKLLQMLVPRLGNAAAQRELEARRQQLQQFLTEQERDVLKQVGLAARAVAAQRERADLARAQADSWRGKVLELQEQEAKGLVSFAETTEANLQWLEAQGKIIEDVIGWQIARVKLKQAQGILPRECGFSSHVEIVGCAIARP